MKSTRVVQYSADDGTLLLTAKEDGKLVVHVYELTPRAAHELWHALTDALPSGPAAAHVFATPNPEQI